MTPQEAQAWKEEVAKSQGAWRVDPIHQRPSDFLIYMGGTNGHFCHVQLKDEKYVLAIGTYINAIPHIGEASFKTLGRKTFDNFPDTLKFLTEKAGIKLSYRSVG